MSAGSEKGRIVGVCSSHHPQAPKKNIDQGMLREDWGLEGDSHAGTKRQVSLLASEDIEAACEKRRIHAPPGAFAENITTSGIDLGRIRVGDRLRLGEAVIEVVAVGKDPSEPRTYSYCGISLLPEKGVFTRVVRSGQVKVGDTVELDSRGRGGRPQPRKVPGREVRRL
ncbi:MAG: MOSC domain-containing protein [Deltaproteobacteria bacterium]|nr:MOSC domain-containing protein [Deltaproteobacteria bacterium]MBW2121997.1 MOSC domain-containing protein [Deltaproteobacteria bacterium]